MPFCEGRCRGACARGVLEGVGLWGAIEILVCGVRGRSEKVLARRCTVRMRERHMSLLYKDHEIRRGYQELLDDLHIHGIFLGANGLRAC